MYLIVSDIGAARAELVARGIEASEGAPSARTVKAWSLMPLQRQLNPQVSSRSRRWGGGALTSQ
jgi:hypothetical protein